MQASTIIYVTDPDVDGFSTSMDGMERRVTIHNYLYLNESGSSLVQFAFAHKFGFPGWYQWSARRSSKGNF